MVAVMRAILLPAIALAASPALASQPSGEAHGPWQVVSITSLSGVAGNDASVVLAQDSGSSELNVHWKQGGPITVSARIKDCDGDEDFDPFYKVEATRWLRMSRREAVQRLHSDFSAWLGQARLACTASRDLTAFKLDKLDAAVADFHERLSYFASFAEPQPKADIR